jgi:hypothetical protein
MIAYTDDLACEHFKFENRKTDSQQRGRGHDRVTARRADDRSIERVMIDKISGKVLYAVLSITQLSASRPGSPDC